MRREEAVAWLEAQGDAVPLPSARPEPRTKAPPSPRERTITRLARELMAKADVAGIPFEELGQAAYNGPGNMRVLPWGECSIELRQEFSRNAARAAGHATPPGMFPQLESFLLREGVRVQEDGTLVQI
jgi:hypothetical protein